MKSNVITILILFIILGIFLSVISLLIYFAVPSTLNKSKIITIPQNSNLKEITHILEREKLITSRRTFALIVKLIGKADKLKAGEYLFPSHSLPGEVLRKIIKGEELKYKVTIPEGYNIYQIAKLLSQKKLINKEKFIKFACSPDFVKYLNIQSKTLEGYLFPDTYKFTKSFGEKNILINMVKRFKKNLTSELIDRAKELKLSLNQVVTLASMIEKEANIDSEKPLISAVFHNRLRLGMKLESDPTVIYSLDTPPRRIYKRDLKNNIPTNTYLYQGVPPHPIANPGLKSILSAIYPANVKYLFFVSLDGITHKFSKSFQEHKKAIRKRYWKRLKMKSR
ncbi:MAG: endolytic transglycosylase MltG [Thermodesulfobacteriota bacterium]|nr:endolytic transglycosylase MltG [Thermodesulfobacteriota bacterium]